MQPTLGVVMKRLLCIFLVVSFAGIGFAQTATQDTAHQPVSVARADSAAKLPPKICFAAAAEKLSPAWQYPPAESLLMPPRWVSFIGGMTYNSLSDRYGPPSARDKDNPGPRLHGRRPDALSSPGGGTICWPSQPPCKP
jgi:hypothetical protein